MALINFVVILSQPTVTDYLNRRVPTEQRATVISTTNLIRSLVLIPSAPLLGIIAEETSLEAAFLTGGILIAALGLPLLVLWTPHLSNRRDTEAIAVEPAVLGGGD